jgi:hypothetical protein
LKNYKKRNITTYKLKKKNKKTNLLSACCTLHHHHIIPITKIYISFFVTFQLFQPTQTIIKFPLQTKKKRIFNHLLPKTQNQIYILFIYPIPKYIPDLLHHKKKQKTQKSIVCFFKYINPHPFSDVTMIKQLQNLVIYSLDVEHLQ